MKKNHQKMYWRTKKTRLMPSTKFQPAVSVDLFVKWFQTGLLLRCLPRDWMSFDFFLGPQSVKKQVFGQVFQLGYDQNQVFQCVGTETKVQFWYIFASEDSKPKLLFSIYLIFFNFFCNFPIREGDLSFEKLEFEHRSTKII